jgi:hypothetical protein
MRKGMVALTICILKGALCSQTDDNDVDPFCLECLCCHCHILDKGIHFWLITVVNLCQPRCREVGVMNSPRRPFAYSVKVVVDGIAWSLVQISFIRAAHYQCQKQRALPSSACLFPFPISIKVLTIIPAPLQNGNVSRLHSRQCIVVDLLSVSLSSRVS